MDVLKTPDTGATCAREADGWTPVLRRLSGRNDVARTSPDAGSPATGHAVIGARGGACGAFAPVAADDG